MNIIQVREARSIFTAGILRLLPQLASKVNYFTQADLEQIISSPNSYLLIAYEAEANYPILGMLTLTIYNIPSGKQAHIDDVVVDEQERGKGIGMALMKEALKICGKNKVHEAALSSHPGRMAANRLYRKLSFEQRVTNVYRYLIQPDPVEIKS